MCRTIIGVGDSFRGHVGSAGGSLLGWYVGRDVSDVGRAVGDVAGGHVGHVGAAVGSGAGRTVGRAAGKRVGGRVAGEVLEVVWDGQSTTESPGF